MAQNVNHSSSRAQANLYKYSLFLIPTQFLPGLNKKIEVGPNAKNYSIYFVLFRAGVTFRVQYDTLRWLQHPIRHNVSSNFYFVSSVHLLKVWLLSTASKQPCENSWFITPIETTSTCARTCVNLENELQNYTVVFPQSTVTNSTS